MHLSARNHLPAFNLLEGRLFVPGFVSRWVWGRKTASHISGEIMRLIGLQDRRGARIAAIKKVKRESRGSEEGALCCENCHGCVYLVCLSPGWIRFHRAGENMSQEGVISLCHFCCELSSTAEIQTKPSPIYLFIFCQRQNKKKNKSLVLTQQSVQLSLFSDNWGYWRREMLALASVAASYPCGAKNSSSCSHLTSLCHPSPVFKMWRRGYKQQQQSSTAPSEPKQEAQ